VSRKKITATRIESSSAIRALDVRETLKEHVKLSFKFLDFTSPKFNFTGRQSTYFTSLLDRLKIVTNMKATELQQPYQRTLRNHAIDWTYAGCTEKGFGIRNHQQLDDKAFQFSVSVNEHGRVAGALIDNTFYVVWLDPDHQVYD